MAARMQNVETHMIADDDARSLIAVLIAFFFARRPTVAVISPVPLRESAQCHCHQPAQCHCASQPSAIAISPVPSARCPSKGISQSCHSPQRAVRRRKSCRAASISRQYRRSASSSDIVGKTARSSLLRALPRSVGVRDRRDRDARVVRGESTRCLHCGAPGESTRCFGGAS